MRVLKMRRIVAGHQKLTMTNWEDNWSWSSYNYTRSYPRTQQTILWSFGSWSKLETWKWKNLISGCLMSWQQIKKNHLSAVFFYCMQQPFLNWIVTWQKVEFTQQLAMTSSVAEPKRSSKALPKAKPAPEKGSWSLFGGLLRAWFTTAFWIPAKPLYLRNMLSKLMRCTALLRTWRSAAAFLYWTVCFNSRLY